MVRISQKKVSSSEKIQKFNFNFYGLEDIAFVLVIASAFLGLYYGWRLFWFLTDDAFIAFRYISNSMLGYGYVWNPPPFMPVEGYTSFLWVLLLDVIWRISGVTPPDSANWVSLVFSYFTLTISVIMILRMKWNAALIKYRLLFLILYFLAVLGNRTFLAWTSSGLETAMFNFFVILWVFSNYYFPSGSKSWLWSLSTSVTVLSLTRPEGLLFAIATIFMMLVVFWHKTKTKTLLLGDVMAMSPLSIIFLHLLWRMWTYGQWLPNTFYAKSAPSWIWVKSGVYYLISFVVEYSFWFYLCLVIVFTVQVVAQSRLVKSKIIHWDLIVENFATIIPVLVLLAHFGYYTFVIGGDYFEYRIYSHLIILIFISTLWMLNLLDKKPLFLLAFYAIFVVASWMIPWTHWYFTRNMNNRAETKTLTVSVADSIQQKMPTTPGFVLTYLEYYDQLQSWLIDHYVCIRHQEHKVLWQHLVEYYPSREKGELVKGDDFPVTTQQAVGILSWVLPHVNIIDLLGLSDYIIARNPSLDARLRMAHLRQPPDGYVECFDPNIRIRKNNVSLLPRTELMTADRIIFCESYYLQKIRGE